MKRTVFITGASSGIGRASALALSLAGFSVFAGVRSRRDGEGLVRESGGALTPVRCDVTDRRSISAAVRILSRATGGSLYGLLNNAGIIRTGPLEALSLEDIDEIFRVDVIGLMAVTRACLPLLRAGEGRIVNMSSAMGLITGPGWSCYSAAKFAVEAFSDAMRTELAPFGVKVAVIEPCAVRTAAFAKGRAQVEGMLRACPPEVRRLYAPVNDYLEKNFAGPPAMPAQRVARAVVCAFSSRRPRRRYVVGEWKDAALLGLVRRLPAPARERIVRNVVYGPPADKNE